VGHIRICAERRLMSASVEVEHVLGMLEDFEAQLNQMLSDGTAPDVAVPAASKSRRTDRPGVSVAVNGALSR
jgi:hypothetical protein